MISVFSYTKEKFLTAAISRMKMVTRKFFLALLAVGALNLISVSTDQGDCFGPSEHPTCSPACANLQNITAKVQSNMTIYLCPERVEINSAITLENYSDVAFLGDSIKKTQAAITPFT